MAKTSKKRKNKALTILIIILLLIIVLSGIGMMAYPILAARYAESVRSEIQTSYEEIIKEVDTSEIDAIRAAAMQYNADLAAGVFTPLDYEENGYYEQLVLPKTDVMCYISIPKIDVYLPVYHGVGNEALDKGAGHMEQSSLPVGGINTHTVISAHTGMAQSPMFTDLELLEHGDIFQIKVLGEALTYEVDDIQVVLPQEVDSTRIQKGEDLASLITCTPYGINSHRLVVQGHRIETPTEEEYAEIIEKTEVKENKDSVWTQQYWNSVKIGGLIVLIIFLILLVVYSTIVVIKKLKNRGNNEKDAAQ